MIYYQSEDLQHEAWISDAHSGEVQRPAVVYILGVAAFGAMDWDDAKAHLDAGFVVMTPMLRGENGNPGYYEMSKSRHYLSKTYCPIEECRVCNVCYRKFSLIILQIVLIFVRAVNS